MKKTIFALAATALLSTGAMAQDTGTPRGQDSGVKRGLDSGVKRGLDANAAKVAEPGKKGAETAKSGARGR